MTMPLATTWTIMWRIPEKSWACQGSPGPPTPPTCSSASQMERSFTGLISPTTSSCSLTSSSCSSTTSPALLTTSPSCWWLAAARASSWEARRSGGTFMGWRRGGRPAGNRFRRCRRL